MKFKAQMEQNRLQGAHGFQQGTYKPPQSLLIGNRLRLQSHPKAPPKLPQCYSKARNHYLDFGPCLGTPPLFNYQLARAWRAALTNAVARRVSSGQLAS